MDNIHSLTNNSSAAQASSIPHHFGFQYDDHFMSSDHHNKQLSGLPNRDHLPLHLQQHFGDDSNQAKPLIHRPEDSLSSRVKMKQQIYSQNPVTSLASHHSLINSQPHLHHLQSVTSSYSAASIGSEYIPNAHSSSLKHHPDMQLVAAHLRMASSDIKFTPPNAGGVVHLDPFNVLNPVYGASRNDQNTNDIKSQIYKAQSQMNMAHASSSVGIGNNFTNAFGQSNYTDQDIVWKAVGVNSPEYAPIPLQFNSRSGPVVSEQGESALTILRRLLDEELVTMIIGEMNNHGRKIVNEEVSYTNNKKKKAKLEKAVAQAVAQATNTNGNTPSASSASNKKPTEWVEIDTREFWSFMAIMFYMSVVRIPGMRRYWNKDLWGQPVVQELMNRDRFCTLLRCLEFADINDENPNDFFSLSRVNPLLEKMCKNFRAQYNPEAHLSLERSILQANGKFKYKTIPSEDCPEGVPPFGIKSYLLCESKTGYVLDLFVHTGKSSDYSSELGDKLFNATYTDLAACKLLNPFVGKGHTVFTDVYYTNPLLFTFLAKEAAIECVGVANVNTEHYPEVIKPGNTQIGKGETVNMVGEVFNRKILAQTWRIKEDDPPRHVMMLSTKHPPCTKVVAQKHKGYLHKPLSHLEFREYFGALDKLDLTCATQLPGEEGPATKFPYKLFIRFFNVMIHNAFVIWRHFDPKANLGYGTQFRLAVMKELKSEFDQFKRQIAAIRTQNLGDDQSAPLHQLTKTPYGPNERRLRRKCVHCFNAFGKRTQTSKECKLCDQGFCRACFNNYHIKLNAPL